MKLTTTLALFMGCCLPALAADGADDFKREGSNREVKDAMEGKAPPALRVQGWMNVDGESLTLESLRGKVVVLDFWGTW